MFSSADFIIHIIENLHPVKDKQLRTDLLRQMGSIVDQLNEGAENIYDSSISSGFEFKLNGFVQVYYVVWLADEQGGIYNFSAEKAGGRRNPHSFQDPDYVRYEPWNKD